MKEIGITSNYVLKGDWREALVMAKAAGFDSVMIAEDENFEAAVKYAFEIGLKIPFVHLDYAWADNIWTAGLKQEKCIETVIKGIGICAKYGITTAVMHLQRDDCLYTLVGPDKHGLEGMKRILIAAERHNVRIAVENLDAFNIGHIFYMLDNIKSPWLGFCYDCGHHNLYTPEIDLLKKYGDRCFAVHLHDNLMDWHKGMDNSPDLHLLPGDGKIDFNRVLQNLEKAGYQGTLMFEIRKNMFGNVLYNNITIKDFLTLAYQRCNEITNKR